MRERLPHSNKRHGPTDGLSPTDRKKPRHQHSSKKKGMAATKHRRAVGVGVVTELTSGGHAQVAGAYYAAGNSCEQAVFAAYAGEMGLSMVGALQAAPKRKERGALCGAYRAGVAVLSRLISLKAINDGDVALDGEEEAQNDRLEADGAAKPVVDKPEAGGDGKNVVDGKSVDVKAGDAKPVDDMHAVVDDFMNLFLTEFGSLECAEIKAGRKDCLDVITTTARIVDQVLSRHGL